MTTRRRIRTLLAGVAVACLLLAGCGTRLDHDTVARAAQGTGTQADSEQGVVGEQSVPGQEETLGGPAGETPGNAAASGTDEGTGTGAGTSRAAEPATPVKGSEGGAKGREGGTAKGEPIVIGSVGTYSGVVGSIHGQGARAVQAWAAATNDNGGINGRLIQVIVMDDGGDAARSRSQVQQLVEKHKVDAIVYAGALTASVNAWKGYVEDKRVPVIGGSGPRAFNESPVLFQQNTDMDSYMFGTVLLGAHHGEGKKLGALACTEEAGCKEFVDSWFDKGMAKRAGLDPRYRASISLTQPDFTSECIAARNAGVDLLSVLGDARTTERVASSCRRQNYNPQFLGLPHTTDASTPSKPGLENMIVATGTFPHAGLSTPAFREFEAAWKKHGSGPAKGSASMGWASAKIFEAAAKKAGANLSRETLLNQLYTFKNERFGGLTVPLTFSRNGTAGSPCIFYMQARAGSWTAPDGDKPTCW